MSANVITIRPLSSSQTGSLKITETVTTRDHAFSDHTGWGSWVTAPPGVGWTIEDFGDEKYTTWRRRRLIPSRGRP
jgi:hypothetical protein